MVRILVCGDAEQRLPKICSKLESLHAKSGPFAFMILLSSPGILPIDFSLPFPVYFAAQDYDSSDVPREVRRNIHYVGAAASLRLHGLNLVLIASGYDDPTPSISDALMPPEIHRALQNCGARGKGFAGVDALACPMLPAVNGQEFSEIETNSKLRSGLIARIATLLRPRYHFCSGKSYLAYMPFKCAADVEHCTRLVAVAAAGISMQKSEKSGGKTHAAQRKWVFAADVAPLDQMTSAQRTETLIGASDKAPYVTDDEHSASSKKNSESGVLPAVADRISAEVLGEGARGDAGGEQFFWEIRNNKKGRERPSFGVEQGTKRARMHKDGEDGMQRLRERRKRPRKPSIGTPVDAKCWFCLANEKDVHLVIDVGEHVYIAMAKGGVTRDHLLIVPIDHVHSSMDLRLSEEMADEIERYKECIKEYFDARLNGCRTYFFERAVHTRGGSKQMHMHVQAIPIRKEVAGKIVECATDVAKRFEIPLQVLQRQEGEALPSHTNDIRKLVEKAEVDQFFYGLAPDETRFLHLLKMDNKKAARHPLHFGRAVAATALGKLDKVDWKVCVEEADAEEANADRVRDLIADFLPSPE